MEFLMPFLGFVLIATLTPGPNNLLLATSGIRFGVRKTIPHVIGIHCGIYTLVVLCGLGLGQLLLAVPAAVIALKVFGSAYLLYLAWNMLGFQLATQAVEESARPMGIMEASLFQFSNPKAWMMATTGLNISFEFNNNMLTAVMLLCLGFGTLGTVCNFAWVWFGSSLRGLLAVTAHRQWINGGLAVITVVTAGMFWVV